ncbi:MAG: HincII family type II restriction endonuclease [Promethearchaeota archaeon]
MPIEEIKRRMEEIFQGLNSGQLTFPRTRQMVGHSAGIFVRDRIKEILVKNLNVLEPEEFLAQRLLPYRARLLKAANKSAYINSLFAELGKQWWWKLCSRGKRKVRAYLENDAPLGYKQEDTPDLVINGEAIVYVNIKSHNIAKTSRHPNIMSAKKILDLFDWIATQPDQHRKPILENVQILFIGVSWYEQEDQIIFEEIEIRDFFCLDLSQIPTINFDAAIQIQWHVADMVELDPPPPRLDFVREFVETLNQQWKLFIHRRNESYVDKTRNIIAWVEQENR